MNRLLQGDVGSGKTVVAIAAMLLAVEAGFQAALMAPTQILAEQHHAVLRRWLEPLGVPISLRTGARKEDPLPLFANTPRLNSGSIGGPPVASGGSPDAPSEVRYGKGWRAGSDPQTEAGSHHSPAAGQIFVGTHALLYEPDGLENPGLIVIDEQHKFGVAQRGRPDDARADAGCAGDDRDADSAHPDDEPSTAISMSRQSTRCRRTADGSRRQHATRKNCRTCSRFCAANWKRAGRLMSFIR